jgi:SAM-dependent methyltransferase
MINFERLRALAAGSGPEAASTSQFWTDPHIAPILLKAHLDPSTDAASRRPEAIEATIRWLESSVLRGSSRILDLGCGPGLYALPLARGGHRVRGMDFSAISLDYARASAREAGLDIEYAQGNYVTDDLGSGYDLAMIIYCDLGALSPQDRAVVLRKARECLAPGGTLVFDFVDESVLGSAKPGKEWSMADSGFWSPRPHLALEETRHFPELKMIQRMTLLAEEGTGRVERFMIRDWYFSEDEVRELAREAGFASCDFRRGLLPAPVWGAPDPIFAVARA